MNIYGIRYLSIVLAATAISLCSCSRGVTVSVYNPTATARNGLVVEIDASSITARLGKAFSVKDADGNAVTSQLTYDGKVLIQSDFPGLTTRKFVFKKTKDGEEVVPADTFCVGQIRHDMQDDFTWENDRGGYRLYGPSYRKGGGNVSGYDIWTKSVDYPVLASRYDDHMAGKISYHKDYGNGMDVYTVGHTLGAGMNALVLPSDEIAYPCAYQECDIIENGPLRMTAKITCYPETIGEDKDVVETRTITLDKGSWLNRTEVSYEGLSKEYGLINGIVVHKQNPDGYVLDEGKRYLVYADLTDNPKNDNGTIYIGIVNAEEPESTAYESLEPNVGDAVGHIMSRTSYKPGSSYVYYWGSGWSKGGVTDMKAWTEYLGGFHDGLLHPLEVRVK
ncbi:MAG: DUF4861 domain-containing protein [Muribaculaceae bacterium]|nr:DUF4861 domain-containing protein [Muribaculaceae bacterium]